MRNLPSTRRGAAAARGTPRHQPHFGPHGDNRGQPDLNFATGPLQHGVAVGVDYRSDTVCNYKLHLYSTVS
jgi:hypothetical protein